MTFSVEGLAQGALKVYYFNILGKLETVFYVSDFQPILQIKLSFCFDLPWHSRYLFQVPKLQRNTQIPIGTMGPMVWLRGKWLWDILSYAWYKFIIKPSWSFHLHARNFWQLDKLGFFTIYGAQKTLHTSKTLTYAYIRPCRNAEVGDSEKSGCSCSSVRAAILADQNEGPASTAIKK